MVTCCSAQMAMGLVRTTWQECLAGMAARQLASTEGVSQARRLVPTTAELPDTLREDAALFLDLDMAVLSANPAVF